MAESTFRGVISFFDRLGIYDVVLPFLLVYVAVFAILEKTAFFGKEKVGKEEYTRKNANAMFAFVVAFLTISSTKIVSIINEGMAKIILLMLVSISFMMLIGTFFGTDKVELTKGWRVGGMVAMLIGVLLIFSYQLGWLEPAWDYVLDNWDGSVVGSIVLLILVVWFMSYIGKTEKPAKEGDNK